MWEIGHCKYYAQIRLNIFGKGRLWRIGWLLEEIKYDKIINKRLDGRKILWNAARQEDSLECYTAGRFFGRLRGWKILWNARFFLVESWRFHGGSARRKTPTNRSSDFYDYDNLDSSSFAHRDDVNKQVLTFDHYASLKQDENLQTDKDFIWICLVRQE